jgi:hypothetical protein
MEDTMATVKQEKLGHPTCIWDEKLARNGRFQVTLGLAEPGPNVEGQYRSQEVRRQA